MELGDVVNKAQQIGSDIQKNVSKEDVEKIKDVAEGLIDKVKSGKDNK